MGVKHWISLLKSGIIYVKARPDEPTRRLRLGSKKNTFGQAGKAASWFWTCWTCVQAEERT